MLVPYGSELSDQQRHKYSAIAEVLRDCEPEVVRLLADHRKMSTRWMPHEVVPWGRGEDFNEKPWSPEQNPLSPEVSLTFETNLLTEDNLPYYHALIARMVPADSALAEWNRIWTSEEAAHASAMRDYAYLMRVVDPVALEHNRLAIMQEGFTRQFEDPIELLAYTPIQELATRVSHMKTGQKAGEPILLKLMSLVARDENFHYIFYRGLAKAILERVPDLMLPAILNQLYSFAMPGACLSDFANRTQVTTDLGIYGPLEHRDLVVKPVLQFWGIEKMTGLSPESARTQERIMKIFRVLDRLIDRQQNGKAGGKSSGEAISH